MVLLRRDGLAILEIAFSAYAYLLSESALPKYNHSKAQSFERFNQKFLISSAEEVVSREINEQEVGQIKRMENRYFNIINFFLFPGGKTIAAVARQQMFDRSISWQSCMNCMVRRRSH